MSNLAGRLIVDEDGQDLAEYALLIALVVLVSVAAWNAIVAAIGLSYQRHDAALWDLYWRAPGS